MIPDFTILLAVDVVHLQELRWAYPTWIRHKPELAERPLVVMVDGNAGPNVASLGRSLTSAWWDALGSALGEHRGPMECVFVGGHGDQRERMLSAFVLLGPNHVRTPWYLKLDTDALAVEPGPWIDPAWFDDDPAFIAPKWSYTKPATMIDRFNHWAGSHPELKDFPTPNHVRREGNVAKHRRIISYCMFGNTAWTRWAASLCASDGRLPIPSQDTYLWAVAARTRKLWRAQRFAGFRHVGGGGLRLKVAAQEAMKGAAA